MGKITDGATFDSDWIEEELAQFKDKSKLLAERMRDLKQEIEKCEEDYESIRQKRPGDRGALAAAEAYLAGLRQTEKMLYAEGLR